MSEARKHQFLGLETKIDKIKTTLCSQAFKVQDNKVPFILIFGL